MQVPQARSISRNVRGEPQVHNDFHEDAFAAIEAGDAKGARQAMEQDLLYFARFLLNLLALEQGEV